MERKRFARRVTTKRPIVLNLGQTNLQNDENISSDSDLNQNNENGLNEELAVANNVPADQVTDKLLTPCSSSVSCSELLRLQPLSTSTPREAKIPNIIALKRREYLNSDVTITPSKPAAIHISHRKHLFEQTLTKLSPSPVKKRSPTVRSSPVKKISFSEQNKKIVKKTKLQSLNEDDEASSDSVRSGPLQEHFFIASVEVNNTSHQSKIKQNSSEQVSRNSVQKSPLKKKSSPARSSPVKKRSFLEQNKKYTTKIIKENELQSLHEHEASSDSDGSGLLQTEQFFITSDEVNSTSHQSKIKQSSSEYASLNSVQKSQKPKQIVFSSSQSDHTSTKADDASTKKSKKISKPVSKGQKKNSSAKVSREVANLIEQNLNYSPIKNYETYVADNFDNDSNKAVPPPAAEAHKVHTKLTHQLLTACSPSASCSEIFSELLKHQPLSTSTPREAKIPNEIALKRREFLNSDATITSSKPAANYISLRKHLFEQTPTKLNPSPVKKRSPSVRSSPVKKRSSPIKKKSPPLKKRCSPVKKKSFLEQNKKIIQETELQSLNEHDEASSDSARSGPLQEQFFIAPSEVNNTSHQSKIKQNSFKQVSINSVQKSQKPKQFVFSSSQSDHTFETADDTLTKKSRKVSKPVSNAQKKNSRAKVSREAAILIEQNWKNSNVKNFETYVADNFVGSPGKARRTRPLSKQSYNIDLLFSNIEKAGTAKNIKTLPKAKLKAETVKMKGKKTGHLYDRVQYVSSPGLKRPTNTCLKIINKAKKMKLNSNNNNNDESEDGDDKSDDLKHKKSKNTDTQLRKKTKNNDTPIQKLSDYRLKIINKGKKIRINSNNINDDDDGDGYDGDADYNNNHNLRHKKTKNTGHNLRKKRLYSRPSCMEESYIFN